MEKLMVSCLKIVGLLTLVTSSLLCQTQGGFAVRGQNKAGEQDSRGTVNSPADDISGMYSFLKEGEFLQINLEENTVTGYISRLGDTESDHGLFLDQFFEKASIQGHEVFFSTKVLHGVWYEFKGKYERGPGKSKAEDGYFILRGTLKENSLDANNKTVSHARELEFKLLQQPDDSDQPPKDKKPKH